MPSTPLRNRFLPALAVALTAAALAVPLPAAAAGPGTADPAAAQRAAGWLSTQLSPKGTVVGSFPGSDGQPVYYTDWGRSLDAALGLLAAGGQDDVLDKTLASVQEPAAVAEYTQGAPGDRTDAAYAGATGKLAFVVEVTGGDATKVGGVDLLAQLLSLGTAEGRFADRSDFGNFANLFGHAFGLLALDQAGRTPADALVQGLLHAQCPDGSFPEQYEPKAGATCTGQVDATGLVLQALAALDLEASDAAMRARTWLSGQQASDGSFPGEAPVNSTGYAALGLTSVGAPSGTAVSYLAGQQNSDGGLRRGAGTGTGSDLFATAQALPALAGTTFQCGRAETVAIGAPTITATAPAAVTLRGSPDSVVELFAYSRPSTDYRPVRTVTLNANGLTTLDVRPGTNTRLYLQQPDCPAGPSVVLNVRTALSLAVARNGSRDYTFSGRSLPARTGGLIVSVYRVTDDGRSVLAGQTRASTTTGEWTLRRTFTGTGRFGFVVRTGQDLQNAPGSSNVRSLLVT